MASISTRKEISGYPFSNVFSVSDGADLKEASGVPYFYLSRMEMSVHDWQVTSEQLKSDMPIDYALVDFKKLINYM